MSTPPTLQGVPLGGLRLGAPLGAGAGGVAWAGTLASGERVAIRVLADLDPYRRGARQRRLDALRGLRHRGLARVLTMPDDTDERLLVCELVLGPTLGTVRTGRLGLTEAESLGLARDLAEALTALHALGLAHGDVSPANVVMRPDEDGDGAGPVLIDLAEDLAAHAGTPGFVAPEVRGGSTPTPAADLWSLATLCVWATQVHERDRVAGQLRLALAQDPAGRPSAASLAASLAALPRVPVRVPPPSVLAGATLREQAQRATTVVRPTRRPRARHRRTSLARRVAAVAAALAVLAAGFGAWSWWTPGSEAPRTPSASTQTLTTRVAELVALRDQALMAGDAEALAALTVDGSAAEREDLNLLAELSAAHTTLSGLRTEIDESAVLSHERGQAIVRTVLVQEAYDRTQEGVTEHVGAVPPRCVELALQLVQDRWLVQEAEPCPAA